MECGDIYSLSLLYNLGKSCMPLLKLETDKPKCTKIRLYSILHLTVHHFFICILVLYNDVSY